MPIQKRWVVAKGGGYLRLRSWQAWLIPAYQVAQSFPVAIPLPMCSRKATGRLLPMLTLPTIPAVAHGTCTSTVVAWTAAIRAAVTAYGVYEADTAMMLHDLVI